MTRSGGCLPWLPPKSGTAQHRDFYPFLPSPSSTSVTPLIMIRPSLCSASLLFLLLSLALSERIPTEAEKRQASRQKHLAPIIATSSPQDGVLRRYASPEDCYRDPSRTQWQSSASFATDICHNLNPHLTRG